MSVSGRCTQDNMVYLLLNFTYECFYKLLQECKAIFASVLFPANTGYYI